MGVVRSSFLLGCSIGLSWSPSARAGQSAEVEWSAPPSCPSRAEITERIERALEGAGPVAVRATVTRRPSGYHAQLFVRGARGDGTRELDAPTCATVSDMAVVVVAMSATTEPEEPAPAPSPSPAPEQVDGPSREAAVDPPAQKNIEPRAEPERASSGPRARASIAPRAGLDFGLLPAAAPVLGGAIAWSPAPWIRAEIGGGVLTAQSTPFDGSTAGARFSAWSAGARACLSALQGAVELGPCLGAEIAHVDASGFGGAIVKDGGATWWSPSAAGFVRWRVTEALEVGVGVEALVPISRRRFVFSDLGELHRPAVVGARVFFAPEVRF
jgi:hypothetical protein